jgi:hypothetical protein
LIAIHHEWLLHFFNQGCQASRGYTKLLDQNPFVEAMETLRLEEH